MKFKFMKLSWFTIIVSLALIAILILSVVNTVYIFENRKLINENYESINENYESINENQKAINENRDHIDEFMDNNSIYDYVLFKEEGLIKARNGITGKIEYVSPDASFVINSAITSASNIYIKQDTYNITSDITLYNKKYAQIISNGAIFNCSGQKIIIKGDTYDDSRNNLISGLDILNGTILIDDSFKTTITGVTFENSTVGLEIASSNTWSEGTKIEDTYFIKCAKAIVFRSPGEGINATASYANTEIVRCYFNIVDNSTGIIVEPGAQFCDSIMENVRMWLCEYNEYTNQTGILVQGTMKQTLLSNVVFESFLNITMHPDFNSIYAINIDTNHNNYSAPILAGGNSFLGSYTARVYNPYCKWIYGLGGLFSDYKLVTVGLNNNPGPENISTNSPFTIADFKAHINIKGIDNGETIKVNFVFEYIDHAKSLGIEKTFTADSALWLNQTEILHQYPSQNVLWAIIITAQTNRAATNAQVAIDIFGATT